MLIHAYGLFWRRDEVPWSPGRGRSAATEVNPFSMLGHVGEIKPKLKIIDVRPMHGVYLLHNNYGPYYVGLAKGQGGLGSRLRDHTKDQHKDKWDAFSWFAFDRVLQKRLATGLTRTKASPLSKSVLPAKLIEDVEAMLILALGTTERGNLNHSNMVSGDEWSQVKLRDKDYYLARAIR